jgi:hypothetical protein
VQTALGVLTLPEGTCHEGEVTVLIRPDAASLDLGGLSDPSLPVDGEIVERSFRGGHTRIVVRANETLLEFEVDSTETLPPVGARIRLALRPEAITCLPAS